MIPIGPWRPDAPEGTQGVSPDVSKVRLLPDQEFGVMYGASFALEELVSGSVFSTAPKGYLTAVTTTGVYKLFVCTPTNIYSVDSDGVRTSIGSGYNLPAGDRWSACQFGTKAIFTNKNDGMLQYDIELGGAVTAITGAPKARIVKLIFGVLFAFDCDGDNRLIRNSDYDYSEWDSGVAGYQPIPDGTELQGGEEVSSNAAIVLTKNTAYVLSRRGDAQLYDMGILARNTGAANPWCIVPSGSAVYYVDAYGGFKAATLGGVAHIGDGKVDNTIFSGMNEDDFASFEGALDPRESVVRWRYTGEFLGGTAPFGSTSEYVDYYIRLNDFVPGVALLKAIFTAATPGYTMEQLDDFGDMDSITISLDDRHWFGGSLELAGMNASLGFFTEIQEGGYVSTAVQRFPHTVLGRSVTVVTNLSDNLILHVYTRDRLSDNETDTMVGGSPSSSAMEASGRTKFRARGKIFRFSAVFRGSGQSGDPIGDPIEATDYIRGIDEFEYAAGGPR